MGVYLCDFKLYNTDNTDTAKHKKWWQKDKRK